MRGGEKCLEVFCELYPDSPIYTLFCEPEKISETIKSHSIHASRVQQFPFVRTHYRYYLPFFPGAMKGLRVDDCDLVLSTSHCAAKGLSKPSGARHICYCFTPMRYAWPLFDDYFGGKGRVSRAVIRRVIERLKRWDLSVNDGVDRFVAISEHIRRRIGEFYGREADVIYPPVDTVYFTPDESAKREDYYLIVSALVPYKRLDLAVRAFKRLGRRLVVIGSGPESAVLRREAGPRTEFLGWQSDAAIRNHYRRARALVFPGEEDFGIVPVEMQACGGPVIALGRGGALETVAAGMTGVFFETPTEDALGDAVTRFEKASFSAIEARANALRFGRERFKDETRAYIEKAMAA